MIDLRVSGEIQDGMVAARRGNAIKTVISRYTDTYEIISNLIDRQEMTTDMIDRYGNIVEQTTNTYVYSEEEQREMMTTSRHVENFEINNRGDAYAQHITSYTVDNEENLIMTGYQEINSRSSNSTHNATN